MAHEIDMTTGSAAVFVTASGGPPWHKLGTVIEKAANSREAIKLAHLDWIVEQWPAAAITPGSLIPRIAGNHVANVRLDTMSVLGIVGRTYHPFQNREAFDFMDSLVGDKLAMFESAGSLKGGRRVWMLAKIPREYRAGPDDLIKPYVLLVNSFDGSTSLRMLPTTVRVVCQNTLNLALSHAGSEGLAIRHRPNLEERVHEAREKLGIIAARFDQFDVELHAMLATQLTTRKVNRYFETLVPPPEGMTDREKKNRDETLAHFNVNLQNDRNNLRGVRGSVWAAYNAVSEWADHQRPTRGGTELARAESRLDSIWFGSSHRIKQRAYQQALELVGNN